MSEQTRNFTLNDYMTAQRASDAVQMPLVLPNGTRTADYLLVVGTESAEFRTAKYEQEQRAIAIAALPAGEARMKAVEDARMSVLAACVKGWSFDVEFTPTAAKDLLTGAPYLADAVDYFISKRANFFAQPSTTSSRTQKRKQN